MSGRPALRSVFSVIVAAAGLLVAMPALAQPASPGASAVPSGAPAPRSLSDATDPLPAGRYRDDSTGHALEFDLGDGWALGAAPTPGVGFALVRDEPGNPYFAIATFDGTVFDAPCRTAENADTFGHADERVDATPEGFVEHISAHPFVTASEPAPVEYGGLPGLAIDVTVDVPDECEPKAAWLWAVPAPLDDYHLLDGQYARLIALQVGDDVIVTSSEVDERDALAPLIVLTDAVLDSLEVVEAG